MEYVALKTTANSSFFLSHFLWTLVTSTRQCSMWR